MAPSIVFAVHDLTHLHGLAVTDIETWLGRDFTNIWFGGGLARQGGNPYDPHALRLWLQSFGISASQTYVYPPQTLLYAEWLSSLPYLAALGIWTMISSAMFYWAAKPLVPFNPLWLLVGLPFVFFNGQYGAICAGLWLWSFRSDQRTSGLAAGLLTVKPHLGIFLGLSLLAKKRWLQITIAVAVTLGALVVEELRFRLLTSFLTEGVGTQTRLLTTSADQPYFTAMPSALVALRHTPFAAIAQIVACLITAAMLWQVRHRPFEDLCFPLATATFICLPYSFGYDMPVVSLGFAILLYDRWSELSRSEICIAVLACFSPILTITRLAPIILLLGLWLQTSTDRQRKDRGNRDDEPVEEVLHAAG